MAFPIPSHLPRKKDARDVSTQVLTKVAETTSKGLNAKVASSWIAELDETIRFTKVLLDVFFSRIHLTFWAIPRLVYTTASPVTSPTSSVSSPHLSQYRSAFGLLRRMLTL